MRVGRFLRDARAVRIALATGAVGALIVIAACTDVGKSITDPGHTRLASTSSGGLTNAAHVDLCVSASSPAGTYTFVNSNENVNTDLNGGFDQGDGGTGTTAFNQPSGTSYTLAPGGCVRVLDRTAPNVDYPAVQPDSWSAVTMTNTGRPAGVAYSSTDCVLDNGVLAPQPDPCGSNNNPTRAFANIQHGVVVTFNFVASQLPAPQFVIGDVEPHGINANIYFWGSQWWKYNDMSQIVSPGVASNKGFTIEVQPGAGCGTWISRVGNSPPPPQTIPSPDILIVVTRNVIKTGPNLGGDIYQIVRVTHDGNYGPNPGHAARGIVKELVCGPPL